MTAEEYVNFDNELSTVHLHLLIDWRTKLVQELKWILKVGSENDGEVHVNDKGKNEQESFQLTLSQALTMLNRLVHMSGISEDDQNALVLMKKKLEKIVINQKKQTNICDYFV